MKIKIINLLTLLLLMPATPSFSQTEDPEGAAKNADKALQQREREAEKKLKTDMNNITKQFQLVQQSFSGANQACSSTNGQASTNAIEVRILKSNISSYITQVNNFKNSSFEKLKTQQCDNAKKQSDKWCSIANYTPYITSILSPLLGQLNTNRSNQKKQCETAAAISQAGALANATVVSTCMFMRSSCKRHCNKASSLAQESYDQITSYNDEIKKELEQILNNDNCKNNDNEQVKTILNQVEESMRNIASNIKTTIPTCESTEINPMTLIMSIGQLGYTVQASEACKDYLSAGEGICQGDEYYQNQDCPGFCSLPENSQHAKCLAATDICSTPSGKYSPVCICKENPNAAECPNYGNGSAGTGSNGSLGIGSNSESGAIDFGDEQDFLSNDPDAALGDPNAGARLNYKGGNQGGGGLGGGGGGFGGGLGGSGGGGGPGKGPYDTDIIGGHGKPGASGGSGGSGYGGGSGYTGSSYKGVGTGGVTGNKIDLKKYLPKQRAAAIAAKNKLNQEGICFQSCESNWIRVKRATLRKKNTMVPGQ